MQDDDPSGLARDEDRFPVRGELHRGGHELVAHADGHLAGSRAAEGFDQHDGDEIDLLAYWRLLVKRRWLILAILGATLALALFYTLLTPSTYRATATLEIKNQGIEVMQVQGMSPANTWDPEFAQTQIQLLKSRSLAQRVAEDLHLPGSDILQQLDPPSWLQRLRTRTSPGRGAQATGAANHDTGIDLDGATNLIRSGLAIEPIRNTHLVLIHFTSTRPQFSERVANAVASGFIAASMDRQVGSSSYASKYLENQLAQLRSRLEDSEAQLVQYAEQANIVPSSSGASLASQNLSDLNSQLATAQAQRIAAEARWNTVKDTRGTALPADMLHGSILPALQTQLAQLQSQYQEKLRTFKPGYPSMLALKGQIDAVQNQINSEAANIRASVRAQYDATVKQENMLEQKLSDLRATALDVDSRSIRYNILKRDVDTNRQLYNALLQRYKQVSMAGGVRPSNISIIDPAQVPTSRYAPSLTRNLAMALLLGLFLGIGTALVLERLDDTLKTPEDIESRLGIGVLGIIPKLSEESPEQAFEDPRSAFSESYRSVRTALQFSTTTGVPRSLLVTSAAPGEGKSTTALTLARTFAQLGKRVLLVEADLRNPSLGRTLGVGAEIGLSNLLSGTATLDQAIIRNDDGLLDVILSGPLPPSPTELLAASNLASMLHAATSAYDQVIIDSPPVLGIADAPILASNAEATLLAVRSGATKIKAAQAALKRLRSARARVTGGLLTCYDARAAGTSYAGYYGYYGYGATEQLGRDG